MEIKTDDKSERFAISVDNFSFGEDKLPNVFMFLYVPDLKKEEHFHIEVSEEEAAKLCNYLNNYFGND